MTIFTRLGIFLPLLSIITTTYTIQPAAYPIKYQHAPSGAPSTQPPTALDKQGLNLQDAITFDDDDALPYPSFDYIPPYVGSSLADDVEDFLPGDSSGNGAARVEASRPIKVLNIPPYANWTSQGWNIRFHGHVSRQRNYSNRTLDFIAKLAFLFGLSLEKLPSKQKAQLRNVTAEICSSPEKNYNVSFYLAPATKADENGGLDSSGLIEQDSTHSVLDFPYKTTRSGDFEAFVPLGNRSNPPLKAGNETSKVQTLDTYAVGTDTGNATAYLVPNRGFTIISDIDDVLRVTQIYRPFRALLNTIIYHYEPWLNMPDIYAEWSRTIPDVHFHYLTTVPEIASRIYMEFTFDNYPRGSYDTRPTNLSDINSMLTTRFHLLRKIFETFPQRQFILVGDTSNLDLMKNYPLMARMFPNQVQCIFFRNTSATDHTDLLPYNTKGFKGLDEYKYMFFNVPDDLANLDIVNGNCRNASVQQDVTFGWQHPTYFSGASSIPMVASIFTWGSIMCLILGMTLFEFWAGR